MSKNKQDNSGKHSVRQGLLTAHYGTTVDIEDQQGQQHCCLLRYNTPPLVVGDTVHCTISATGDCVATGFMPRRTLLNRQNRQGKLKAVAANVEQMIIVMAAKPAFNTLLLDQYLVAAELSAIKPLIVINKVDLLSSSQLTDIKHKMTVYQSLCTAVIYSSCVAVAGLETLQVALSDKISVFVGQSGVGKSSLAAKLLSDKTIKTATISATGLGRHTTSIARLYHLPCGGALIDSPGVREFRLWRISSEQLLMGFRDLQVYAKQCQFSNCQHQQQQRGCVVQEALRNGKLSDQRVANFCHLLQELQPHDESV